MSYVLDELDDMVETIKLTYARLEEMYALYLPYFPKESGEIYRLNELLGSLMGNPDYQPRHDKGTGKEVMAPKLAFSLRDDFDRMKMVYADGFQPVEQAKLYTEKVLFRKINQACHPDKTKKFGRKIVLKLRDCMTDAQNAYARRDYSTLELIWIRVCYLRDEIDKLPEADRNRIEAQKQLLDMDMRAILRHPLYDVMSCHFQGDVQMAKGHFGRFLADHLARINAEITKWTEINKTAEDIESAESTNTHGAQ